MSRRAERRRDVLVAKIVFPVADMGVAVRFYESLGFEVERYDDGYAWVRHAGAEVLHLALVADLDPGSNRAAGYWHVLDVGHWHQRFAAAGDARGEVVDQPWGMREFRMTDPSGNLLRVGENR